MFSYNNQLYLLMICFFIMPVFTNLYAQEKNENLTQMDDQIISLNFEYGSEKGRRDGIESYALRFGYEKYLRDRFSVGGELTVKNFSGERKTSQIDALALGISYFLKWHFIELNKWSLYFDHGLGLIFTNTEFPPKGTKINGSINVGIGVSYFVNSFISINLAIKDYHSSNGNGFADNNPAYDATIFSCGISYKIY